MYDKSKPGKNGKATTVEVTDYPMGSKRICELMPAVLEAVHATPVLAAKLFQVNFLTTLSGEARASSHIARPFMCVGASTDQREDVG